MTVKISPKTIKNEFIEKVEKLSGQNIQQCFQCGTCTGSCPMVDDMNALPRKTMRMLQLGLSEKLKNSNTCWVCASCYNCNVVCPRGVDLPKVMEALRLMALRSNQDYMEPAKLSAETLKEYPQIALVSGFRKLTG